MGILDGIEKLITEHGSAAILRERIALAKDEHAALEKKTSALNAENAKLASENQRFELDNYKLKEQISNLEQELAKGHGDALEGEEEKILLALSGADGDRVNAGAMAAHLKMSVTRAEFFLSKLTKEIYISAAYNSIHPTSYRLAQKGREYLVRKNLA